MIEAADAEENWDPQQITIGENDEEDLVDIGESPRQLVNFIIGILSSIFIGIYAGFISREFIEAAVIAAMFFGEAILCGAISNIVKDAYFQNITFRYSLLFALTAGCVLVCGFSKVLFGKKI